MYMLYSRPTLVSALSTLLSALKKGGEVEGRASQVTTQMAMYPVITSLLTRILQQCVSRVVRRVSSLSESD